MSVELYEGCYGVTAGGGIDGPISVNTYSAYSITHPWVGKDGRTYRDDGTYSAKVGCEDNADIIAVFPTREAAEAHLRGEPVIDNDSPLRRHTVAEMPAEPQPVTWPDGVRAMDFGGTEICVSGGHVEISEADGSYSADTARQLAALLVAAADCIERNAE